MSKEQKLARIAREIEQCKVCQKHTLGNAVPGEGDPNAQVLFVGEAPGKEEAAIGRPFIGRSGKLLRKLIASIGLTQRDIFITSVGKYLPASGTPSMLQILHGREHILEQIAVIRPKIVVLLGSVAVQGVLGEKIPIRTRHGSKIEKNGLVYFITFHPAAALRFPHFRKDLESDFLKLKQIITDIL